MDGRVITNKDYIKLLGIHIDYSMNFSGHISELCDISKKVRILMHLHNLIPCSAKLTIYTTWYGTSVRPSTAVTKTAFKNVP